MNENIKLNHFIPKTVLEADRHEEMICTEDNIVRIFRFEGRSPIHAALDMITTDR